MKYSGVLFCVAILAESPLNAQTSTCEQLKSGAYPQIVELDDLLASARKAGVKKDEFETTAAFEAKVTAAGGYLAHSAAIVAWPLTGPEMQAGFEYNADTGVATYNRYAFDGMCLIDSIELPNEVKNLTFGSPGSYSPSGYCFSHAVERRDGKPYTGSNAFGASVQVQPVHETDAGILLGFGASMQDIWTGKPSYEVRTPAFSVTVPADAARSLKENAVALMVLTPKAPFFFQGSHYIEPKIDSPTEVFIRTDYVVADVQCIALADPKLRHVYQVRYVLSGRN